MSTINTQKPEQVLDAIGAVLDNMGLSYGKEDDMIMLEVVGKDIPMEFRFSVNPKKETIVVYSRLPIDVVEEKSEPIVYAICATNYKILNGCFEYDEERGSIFFRMTESYRNSEISEEMIRYLIRCSLNTVDDYNDKLLLISRGLMMLEEYEKEINFK